MISDIINEKLGECSVLMFSFKANKQDIVHHDGETMSNRSTLTEKFAHIHLHGHAPCRDARHLLGQRRLPHCRPYGRLSCEGEEERPLRLCVSAHTDTTFVGVISGVLSLVYLEKVDYATLVTKADQTAVSTEHVAHFVDEIHTLLPFPFNEKNHTPFQINEPNIDDGADTTRILFVHPAVRRLRC